MFVQRDPPESTGPILSRPAQIPSTHAGRRHSRYGQIPLALPAVEKVGGSRGHPRPQVVRVADERPVAVSVEDIHGRHCCTQGLGVKDWAGGTRSEATTAFGRYFTVVGMN